MEAVVRVSFKDFKDVERFVGITNKYNCDISVDSHHHSRCADAKSLPEILSCGIDEDFEVVISTPKDDAYELVDLLLELEEYEV